MRMRVYGVLIILVGILGFFILKEDKEAQKNSREVLSSDVVPMEQTEGDALSQEEAPSKEGHLAQPVEVSKYSKETQEKVNILNEVIISKNDNDPRLDTILKKLTSEDKKAFREIYENTKKESLNERGLVIFLIGRNLEEPQDFDFIKQIVSEEPCMSLANCNAREVSEDPHMQAVESSTLSYPQNVALESIKRISRNGTDNLNETVKQHMKEILTQAKEFPNSSISQKAQSILESTKL